MQITIAVSLLVAICYAADAKNKDKPAPSKTDKRDLLEGNYGERTYLKNVLRSAQGIDYSNQEDTLSGRSSHGTELGKKCVPEHLCLSLEKKS